MEAVVAGELAGEARRLQRLGEPLGFVRIAPKRPFGLAGVEDARAVGDRPQHAVGLLRRAELGALVPAPASIAAKPLLARLTADGLTYVLDRLHSPALMRVAYKPHPGNCQCRRHLLGPNSIVAGSDSLYRHWQ